MACIPYIAHAQAATPLRPVYTLERYDEDWSFLRDASKRTDLFDPIKWIPLGKDDSWFLTLGGELRERFQDVRNPALASPSPPRPTNIFHRTFLFADIHIGPHFRTFVEFVNGEALGTKTRAPRARDRLYVLQTFADVVLPIGEIGGFTLRGGRQQLTFGSSRLVSFRESPNVRRAFDGARAFWKTGAGERLDSFPVRPVNPRLGVFDDSTDRTQLFWGIYGTSPVSPVKGLSLDVYYLGLDREGAPFAQGLAHEHRHTIGARLFGKRTGSDWDVEAFDFDSYEPSDDGSKFDCNVEAALQFGSFETAEIRAWMISSNWGYTFLELPLSPRLGLKADVASGDSNLHDNRLGTFNALFPALLYYSQVRLFEPSNLLNLSPKATVHFANRVNVNVAWSALWRESKADAFYAPPLVPVKGTATSDRFIGQQASATLSWKATAHLNIAANYTHFIPGGSVREAGGRFGNFFLALGQFKF